MRIQFICKKNENYGFQSYTRRSSGLWNSTRFISESLSRRGVHAEIIEVNDNNDIDRNLKRFKPDICVIEALWVVPEKFPILQKLHPNVKFFVHMHSGMPFLALEGIAMLWVNAYPKVNVGLISNSPESHEAYRCILSRDEVTYLPNVYVPEFMAPVNPPTDKCPIDVGCFGAVRPMKNHLLQALASIKFARERGATLRFHINASRVETGGSPVLKNLIQLFDATPDAELVQCQWMEPEDFLNYLHCKIDIGLQVSLTETFNVVGADYVTAGIPFVCSKEVSWASGWSKVVDNSADAIVEAMHAVYGSYWKIRWNQRNLAAHSENAQRMWYDFVKDTICGE